MRVRVIFRGAWRLYGVCDAQGNCVIADFLDVEPGDQLAKDKIKMAAYLDRIAHTAMPPRDNEITHIVDREQRIFQTGIRGVRALWFYDDGRVIVLSHGFPKTTQKTPPGELERARRARENYFKAKDSGDLSIQEDGQ